MADIRRVTEDFAVAPQLEPGELQAVADQGYRLVINNRPDDEVPGQPSSLEMATAARAAGLEYLHIPVRGGPGQSEVDAVYAAVHGADGPVLAFCRSGTRSIVTWSLGQALSGARPRDELVTLGRNAGYDLSGVLSG